LRDKKRKRQADILALQGKKKKNKPSIGAGLAVGVWGNHGAFAGKGASGFRPTGTDRKKREEGKRGGGRRKNGCSPRWKLGEKKGEKISAT